MPIHVIGESADAIQFQTTIRKGETLTGWIDPPDLPILTTRPWRAKRGRKTFYLVAANPDGRPRFHSLHRVLIDPAPGLVVDHQNGNGLDNRRENLRAVTSAVNAQNTGPQNRPGRRSRFKGVSLCRIEIRPGHFWERWSCTVNHGGKQAHQSYHTDEVEAARLYDTLVRKLKGPLAWTNFPLTDSPDTAITHVTHGVAITRTRPQSETPVSPDESGLTAGLLIRRSRVRSAPPLLS